MPDIVATPDVQKGRTVCVRGNRIYEVGQEVRSGGLGIPMRCYADGVVREYDPDFGANQDHSQWPNDPQTQPKVAAQKAGILKPDTGGAFGCYKAYGRGWRRTDAGCSYRW